MAREWRGNKGTEGNRETVRPTLTHIVYISHKSDNACVVRQLRVFVVDGNKWRTWAQRDSRKGCYEAGVSLSGEDV